MRGLVLPLCLGGLAWGDQEARPAGDGARRPVQLWVVTIGIDEYATGIPDCRGAVRDARRVAAWFRDEAGWPDANLLRLEDDGVDAPEDMAAARRQVLKPTRRNLDWAIREWLVPKVAPDDLVVIYYAGQATAVPPPEGSVFGTPARDGILPADANPNNLGDSTWQLEEALEPLAHRNENPIALWLDTSPMGRGEAVGPAVRGEGGPPGIDPAWRRMLDRLTRWPKVTAWMAATDRVSVDRGDGRPGPFVAGLLRGLGRSAAPRPMIAALDAVRLEDAAAEGGFRWSGGVPSHLTVRPASLQAPVPVEPEVLLQRGHAAPVSAAAFTSDGRLLVTGSDDSTIRIWDARDWSLLRVVPGHLNRVTRLAISRDGRFVLSGDGMGSIRGFDLERMAPVVAQMGRGRRRVEQLLALADGRRFASRDDEGEVAIWEVTFPAAAEEPGGAAAAPGEVPLLTRKVAPFGGARWIDAPVGAEGSGAAVLLALDGDGRLHALKGDGSWVEWETTAKHRKSRLVGLPGGARAALSDGANGLMIVDLANGEVVATIEAGGAISDVAVSMGGTLALASRGSVRLVPASGRGEPIDLAVRGEPTRLEFSGDGRMLVGDLDPQGRRQVGWELGGEGGPRAIAIEPAGELGSTARALKPDEPLLARGEGIGGFRLTRLPTGEQGARVASARGRIEELAASASGRWLLEVTHEEDQALVWDLEDGRGARVLPGRWRSGALVAIASADGSKREHAALIGTPGDPEPDGLYLLPLDAGPGGAPPPRLLPATTIDPGGTGERPIRFSRVAASGDGTSFAAIQSEELPGAVLAYWAGAGDSRIVRSGKTDSPLTCVALSADGREVAAGTRDGTAVLFAFGEGRVAAREEVYGPAEAGVEDRALLAVGLEPGSAGRIGTTDRAGVVRLWGRGATKPVEVARLGRPALDVAFGADGNVLAASAMDGGVWFWAIDGGPGARPRELRTGPRDRHAEEARSLVALPAAPPAAEGEEPARPVIASGSYDTTIRFWTWGEDASRSIGTLAAVLDETWLEGAPAAPSDELDWVAYAPDGRFTGSMRGLDRIKMIRGEEVLTTDELRDEEWESALLDFDLAIRLRRGRQPGEFPERGRQPVLTIADPPAAATTSRTMVVSLSVGDADASTLRLYHNRQPIGGGAADFDDLGGGRYAIEVRLRGGDNTFYALAGPRGPGFHVASREVKIRYDGETEAGKIHVLALGVGDYEGVWGLKYAVADAEVLSRQIWSRAEADPDPLVAGRGVTRVLKDGDAGHEGVRAAFDEIRAATAGRPQDTVLVFVAGHTGVYNDRYHLLLPGFPFAKGGERVGANGPGWRPAADQALPYYEIELGLSHLQALQRLVIVDACQAGAIGEDRAVRLIRDRLEAESSRAKVSYILAARKGEVAGESVDLGHGLLTYALLRGLETEPLNPLPEELGLTVRASADANGDRIVTSDELREYAEEVLPALTASYPRLALRGRPEAGDPAWTIGGSSGAGSGPPFKLVGLGPIRGGAAAGE